MSFNMQTFTVAFIICNIIQIAAFNFQFTTIRIYSGIGFWHAGFIFITAGLLLMLLNGIIEFSVILAVMINAFYITGLYLIHAGIKRFFGKKENIRLFIIFSVVYMLAIIYFSAVDNSIRARIVIFSLAWSAIFLLMSHTLVKSGNRFTVRSARLLAGLFFLIGIFLIARAVITATGAPLKSFFTPSAIQVTALILLFIVSNSLSFSLIIMVNQRLNGEMKDARDEARLNMDKAEKAGYEKELLLKEVHHRIKNNMNTIIALLSIQADTVKEPSTKTALNDAEGRVRSMMILYDKLYRSESFNEIPAAEYLSRLSDEIVNGFPHGKNVIIRKDIDDFMMVPQTLFLAGIMVNELLTNSMKYAFSETYSGMIKLTVHKTGKRISIIIEDNGMGFPEGFNVKQSSGFGLQLVSMLTEQLHGAFELDTTGGSRISIEFDTE